MNKLQEAFLRYMNADETKVTAREIFRPLQISNGVDEFIAARNAFNSADAACETQAANVIAVMRELHADDELGDAIDGLGAHLQSFSRFAEQRGLTQFIAESSSSLTNLTKRWRNAAAVYTAFMRLHQLCGQLSTEDFEAGLAEEDEVNPSNVDAKAWVNAKAVFNERLDAYNEETNFELEPHTALADVAHELKRQALAAYDRIDDQYVRLLQDLHESGRLGEEMRQVADASLLSVIRDAMRRVPQLQPQAETEAEPRSVTTID